MASGTRGWGAVPEIPPLPGAVGVTHLRVYDTEAPDGLAGGTPHLHTVCTEAYWVVAGTGAVQTITADGFTETPLRPGALVWFTPGTVHRLVNSGDLEILVVMQNAGLPEAGDMVVALAPDVLADPVAYRAVAELPDDDRTTAGPGTAARRRRDSAVERFTELRAAAEAGDLAPFHQLHNLAGALVASRVEHWRRVWGDGPAAAAALTGLHLDAIARGDASHLAASSVHELPPPGDVRRLGCCGTLGTYVALT